MMMHGMRKIGQSWLGKIIFGTLFGILILSFAVWGIGDIFRGYGRNTVAKVGKQDITIDVMRQAYQNEVQRFTQQLRRSVTPDMARALGIDRNVLARLVTDSALDQGATKLGFAVSDESVVRTITADATFKGINGEFDRSRFNDVLRNSGFNEALYVREQRSVQQRLQLTELISGGIDAPGAAQEVMHRFRNERREAAYLVIPQSLSGVVVAPTEAELTSFYNDRKTAFQAPEYRAVTLIAATSASLADPASISEADAIKRYDEIKTQRFGSAERRRIQRISFPTMQDATEASAKIKSGQTFEAVAAERKINDADLVLGFFEKSQIVDRAVSDAAFNLALNQPSEPVQGTFGVSILRVTEIAPAVLKPFSEVADEVRREMAVARSRDKVTELHDKIEDLRASAKPLSEIATTLKLELTKIAAVDRQRLGKDGKPLPVSTPSPVELVEAVFRSDVGADNEALRTRDGGFIWFDVTNVEPARVRSLDEVRPVVTTQWHAEQVNSRLSAKARELVERLDKGEMFDALAASVSAPLKTLADIARETNTPEFPAAAAAGLYSIGTGKSGSAALAGDGGRIVFQVKNVTVPPFLRTTQEAGQIAQATISGLGEDLLTQYVAKLQADLGVSINAAGLRNATGGGDN
jgi:peptidyl-prolyl cis-trans isomerase D